MAVKMRGGRGELGKVGDDIMPKLMPDDVDARHLHIAHALEKIAVGYGELRQDFLVLDVGLHLEVVGRAPLGAGGEEILPEEVGPHVAIIRKRAVRGVEVGRDRGDRAAAAADLDGGDCRQMRAHVVALPFLKFRGKVRCPRIEAKRGLVATKAHEGFAELFAHGFFVGLEGPVDENPIRFGREVIHQGVLGVLGA